MEWVILLVVAGIVIGWYVFEWFWDRSLFTSEPGRVARNVRPRFAHALLGGAEVVRVLDVRTPAEFAVGALPGAVNLPLNAPDFRQRLGQWDTKGPVLIYCAGGYRSRKAVPILREMGFDSVYHLHRGIGSWKFAGLPLVRPAEGAEGRKGKV